MHRFRLFIQSRSRLIHHWVSYYSCLENVSQPTGGFIFTFSESVFVLVCHSLHSKMTPPLEQSTLCSLIKGHHVDGCVWKRWTFRYLKTTRERHKTCSCLCQLAINTLFFFFLIRPQQVTWYLVNDDQWRRKYSDPLLNPQVYTGEKWLCCIPPLKVKVQHDAWGVSFHLGSRYFHIQQHVVHQ